VLRDPPQQVMIHRGPGFRWDFALNYSASEFPAGCLKVTHISIFEDQQKSIPVEVGEGRFFFDVCVSDRGGLSPQSITVYFDLDRWPVEPTTYYYTIGFYSEAHSARGEVDWDPSMHIEPDGLGGPWWRRIWRWLTRWLKKGFGRST
jgi:hypothetical protein